MRKLHITKAGYWYIVLTIALGVVALATSNNVFYLLECLLLGGIILSGVASERAVSSIRVEIHRGQAIAGRRVRDELRVSNLGRQDFFCIELLEWNEDDSVTTIARVPRVPAGATVSVAAERVFEARGVRPWRGFGVGTAAPFGFAHKARLLERPGSRTIWPDPGLADAEPELPRARGSGAEDSDLRALSPDDDARLIVWKLSARGGDPIVRAPRVSPLALELKLDLECPDAERFEGVIRDLAASVYQGAARAAGDVWLRARGREGVTRVSGRRAVLDFLAQARREGQP